MTNDSLDDSTDRSDLAFHSQIAELAAMATNMAYMRAKKLSCTVVVSKNGYIVAELPDGSEPPRVSRRLQLLREWSPYEQAPQIFPEVRDRAIHMVYEVWESHTSQWAAIEAVASKIGCTAQTLSRWIRKAGAPASPSASATDARVKELEREVRELKRANEILKVASVFFAQAELDRRLK